MLYTKMVVVLVGFVCQLDTTYGVIREEGATVEKIPLRDLAVRHFYQFVINRGRSIHGGCGHSLGWWS